MCFATLPAQEFSEASISVISGHSAANCDVHFAPKIGQSPPTSRIPTSVRVLLRKATCLPAGRFVFLGLQVGWGDYRRNIGFFRASLRPRRWPYPRPRMGAGETRVKLRGAA